VTRRRKVLLVVVVVVALGAVATVFLPSPAGWAALVCAMVVIVVSMLVLVPLARPMKDPEHPPPSHHYFEMYARGIERSGQTRRSGIDERDNQPND
jgi:hypothetical protein